MWIFTEFGFFSVVHKEGDENSVLTVRARVRKDLERLKERNPLVGDIEAESGTDYEFRVRVNRAILVSIMRDAIYDIDYDNFKSAVKKRQGRKRHDIYSMVWYVLLNLSGKARGAGDEFLV